MRLPKNELFLGIVASEIIQECVRQLLRTDCDPFSLEQFCRALGAPDNEARAVLKKLIAAGFISETKDRQYRYLPTDLFIRLKLARIGEGITRERAKGLLKKVLAKALEINADPAKYRGAGVKTLAVFGSYLTDARELSDLDVGYETCISSATEHEKAIAEVTRWWRSGPMAPVDRIPGFLKCRSKDISMHSMAELKQLGTPFRLVMQDGQQIGTLD